MTIVAVVAPPFEVSPVAGAALLALADDELIIGHRHSEWLGLSPFLEEDLAMASIAQDELGHARALFALLWPNWADREAMVVRRPAEEWRSGPLSEIATPTWETHLIRHLLHDMGEELCWYELVRAHSGSVPGLEALASKALAEERYHRRHAIDLVVRLGAGSTEANGRLQTALDRLWPVAVASIDDVLVPGLIAGVGGVCADAGLTVRPDAPAGGHPDRTRRHPDSAEVFASLVEVVMVDPAATW